MQMNSEYDLEIEGNIRKLNSPGYVLEHAANSSRRSWNDNIRRGL